MLQRYFEKYRGWLRSLKAVYVLNNLLNARKLKHNQTLYRRFGLRKSIFAPIGSADFHQKGNAADLLSNEWGDCSKLPSSRQGWGTGSPLSHAPHHSNSHKLLLALKTAFW